MKTIDFPEHKSKEFVGILREIIGKDPSGGYTIEQVRAGMRVHDKLPDEGSFDLEDTEYAFVKDRVERVRFSVIDRDVIAFLDALGVA